MLKRGLFSSIVVLLITGTLIAQAVSEDAIVKLRTEMTDLYSKGDYDGALRATERLVELVSQKYGEGDLSTAKALKNLGIVGLAKGDNKVASNAFRRAGEIFEKYPSLTTGDQIVYADLLEKFAAVRSSTDLRSAASILEKAISLRERTHGTDAVETATTIAQYANLKFWAAEYKESSRAYARALGILSERKPQKSTDVTLVYYRTHCAYRKAGIEDEFELLKTKYGAKAEFSDTNNGALTIQKAKLIHAGVVNGKAVHLEKPVYPAEAKAAYADGTVNVDVLIDEIGKVISACSAVQDVHPSLSNASEIASYKALFTPTTLAGSPVKVIGRITYRFQKP